jgi:hypothetical protein
MRPCANCWRDSISILPARGEDRLRAERLQVKAAVQVRYSFGIPF